MPLVILSIMKLKWCNKILIASILLTGFFLPGYAVDRIPPGSMTGVDVELPVWILTPGGQIDSFSTEGGRGLQMSTFVGETFSGTMNADSHCPNVTDQPCNLESGYGFFEFYSDRIPFLSLALTVNGASPVTNTRDIAVGVKFADDLSGLLAASVTDGTTGITSQLDLGGDNSFTWRLGGTLPDSQVPDRDYFFDFKFEDRAGNVTSSSSSVSIRLDRAPPDIGSIIINGGNLFTNSSTVTVRLRSNDNASDFPTGVAQVRLWNGVMTSTEGKTLSFVEPEMSIPWFLGDNSTGTKVVWAQFRDAAGNWSVTAASDSIVRGNFDPDGTLEFEVDGITVIETSDGTQTSLSSVPLLIGWNEDTGSDLREIIISGGEADLHLNILPQSDPNYQYQRPKLRQVYEIVSSSQASNILYTLKAVFIDAEGNESAPVFKTITLNRDAPHNPIIDSLQISTTSITLSAHVDEYTHDVRYYTFEPDQLGRFGASSGTVSVAYSSDTAIFTDFDLGPNTLYGYTVRAHDDFFGSLDGSKTGEINTLAVPPVPTDLPEAMEISVIRVKWGAGGNPDGTQYFLEWTNDPSFETGVTDNGWTISNQSDVENLSVGTTYYFRIHAQNRHHAITATVSLPSGPTRSYIQPQPPLNFEAKVTSTSILYSWTRSNSTEEGFLIINAFDDNDVRADIPVTSSQNTNGYSYLETERTPNTNYFRRIVSYNHLNDALTQSASSGTLNLITSPAPPLPQPAIVRGSQITPKWGANGNPPDTEYQADIALNTDFTDHLEQSGWVQQLSFDFPGLKPHTTYYLRVQARDRNPDVDQKQYSVWVDLGAAQTQTFDHGQEVNLDDPLSRWRLRLPANALAQDFVIQMETDPSQFVGVPPEALQRATEKARAESDGYRFPIAGGVVQISVTTPEGAALSPALNQQADLTHQFLDIAPQDLVVDKFSTTWSTLNSPLDDNVNVRSSTLRIWVFDPTSESWLKLPANSVEMASNEVHGGLNHFGVFAVMGAPDLEVNDVVAYPVPWRPHGPNAGAGSGQTGTEGLGIRFTNLPQEGKIKIFDFQGGVVKEILLTGNVLEPWDAKNSDNEDVASGTYLWLTEAGGNRKTGKLMVIR